MTTQTWRAAFWFLTASLTSSCGSSSSSSGDDRCSGVCDCVVGQSDESSRQPCLDRCGQLASDPSSTVQDCESALSSQGFSSCSSSCSSFEGAPGGGAGPSSCVSWRQTSQCEGSGPREPQNDETCATAIDSGWSGYCECNSGSVPTDCGHAVVACDDVCSGSASF